MYRHWNAIIAAGVLILGSLAAGIQAKQKTSSQKGVDPKYTAVLWREPSDIASRDLSYGPGGKAHEPHGTFTFEAEDRSGTSPKFDVVDQDGVKWRVKMGPEARPETAASRFVWAVGYFANEDYFMPALHVEKMQHLHRGGSLVSPEGNVHNVRLKRHLPDEAKAGSWSWAKNPFVGTREWYGLRALMAVLNNWDVKDINNSIYLSRDEPLEARYAISDLGASFGPVGEGWDLKGNAAEYSKSRFIRAASPKRIDFMAPAAPGPLYYFNFHELGHCISLFWVGRNIPRADARWIGDLLARLSPKQIHDAFRAAGYSTEEVEQLSNALARRIAELEKL